MQTKYSLFIVTVVCVLLSGCSVKEGPTNLRLITWKDSAFYRIKNVCLKNSEYQVAEVWVQAQPFEERFYLTGGPAISPGSNGRMRYLPTKVHYPKTEQEIDIAYYHLMRDGKEIDFFDNS